jgi:hypothetical protein
MGRSLGVYRLARQHAALLSLLATLGAREAAAQATDDATRGAARTLGTSGVSAYMEGNYAVAREQLERSFYLFPIPTLGLWSARALTRVGLLVEAAERYRQVSLLPVDIGDVAIQRAAQASAERERGELLPRIPGLTFRVLGAKPEEVQISVDGAPLDGAQIAQGLALNPGNHAVTGQRGAERVSSTVALSEGAHEQVELKFAEPAPRETPVALPAAPPALPAAVPATPSPAPASPSSPAPPPTAPSADPHRLARTAGWIGVGLGAAGLGTGVVAYFIGRSKYDAIEADPRCTDDMCDPDVRAAVERYDTFRTVSVVGLIAGGVLGATGITLLVLSREPSADVSVALAGSSITVRGAF